MSYYTILKESPYHDRLPQQLHQHIHGIELQDVSVDYKLPEIHKDIHEYKPKVRFSTKPGDVRIPARLSSPLIPYPDVVRDSIRGIAPANPNLIHSHHASQLETLGKVFDACISSNIFPQGALKFDMDSLKRFGRQSYSHREELINLATLSFAKRATQHDLSVTAACDIPFSIGVSKISEYTSFIIMIQRLRIHIAKESVFPTFNPGAVNRSTEDAAYSMFSNGVYIYQSDRRDTFFSVIACGGHFRMFHKNLGYWFCGPTSYLDYIFTIADILNNLDVLRNCTEYSWASEMFRLMIKFAEVEGHHRLQVDFMKTLEGFLLNMSDYDESHAMNWKPILEAIEELWKLDQVISGVSYDMGLPVSLLGGHDFEYPKESHFCQFITAGKKLSRTHLQEISALHKLIFYAEVSAIAGVNKFLKRVHTKRPMDMHAVKNITRLAKQQFFLAYRGKHKMIPNTIGPHVKIKMLEMYSQKSEIAKIEALPLSWWDDLKIFDCMDNTMTDDPLEFAKDKGALKAEISFGPGDSRKELLQVIEREDYALEDFFSKRKITPKIPLVKRTNQLHNPVIMTDPARLIEKEREQKWEARLFANGELSNKHSLSLVAARMKKALSYFDEQLMTPTDQKRKSLIHEASRELAQPDNYSLLLDIEGHNQSMQYENTSELSEFIGNLFGFDGWGDLSHYFAQLTVYHYDEYLDDVLESHGQYGGIEGWLNPLWTLHTTLMMKLLRVMTDIVVNTIMVYSDDVNAIIQIRQASEPMVQSVFSKIMKHCRKFGMTVKYSQTTLSKHRITMLRQHYADGHRADSTLKRLISVSAGNNPTIVSDELEVAGICSSASSAMELSNHHEACAYLKNYKLGLLLCRLPQMILSRINPDSMISPEELPPKLSNLIYYSKADQQELDLASNPNLMAAAKNDISAYLDRNLKNLNQNLLATALSATYGVSVAESRLVDSPDRLLYLQIYDKFLQDLLFFWAYLPTSLGGLGASLHVNLMLSGHSIGLSKSLHYLHCWTARYSESPSYFLKYLAVTLSVSMDDEKNTREERVVTSTWPSDQKICPATTSVQQSIKSMVRKHTRNKKILEMFELSDDRDTLATQLLNVFRGNFHARIVQFYHENTSIHFIDLLISKVETSSGLLMKVRNITKLRNSVSSRVIENIRLTSTTSRTFFFDVTRDTDIVQELLHRKIAMFPNIRFIEVEEILYDDKIHEVDRAAALLTLRRCAPTHYRNGVKVYDDPKVGNETLYKGELLDNDRMLGNKEELLAAKLVAVTKWLLMKSNLLALDPDQLKQIDCIKACNLALSTLTAQTFENLFHYAPTEIGGEILHRIPNIRFSTMTYIRSEMNRSLQYTTELNQNLITSLGLVDSNVNFDYLRMRMLVIAIVKDKYDSLRRLVVRYGFRRLTGIKDVQFVRPKPTDYVIQGNFKCYSELRGHTLSVMRFRYLSHSYLYEENINEWALMPKISEVITAEQVGRHYINDIILRYARDLDKDYMLVSPDLIDKGVWTPMIEKLYRIDKNWKSSESIEDIEEIASRLLEVMQQRGKVTTIDKSNKVALSLQCQCLEQISEVAPDDIEFYKLVERYTAITQHRRHSTNLSIRLSQYQNILNNLSRHRFYLAQSLLHEYIIMFHFQTILINGEISVHVEGMITEFLSSGLAKLSFMAINPDLEVRLMILGFEYIEGVIQNHMPAIVDSLRDICQDVSSADIIVPETLPSIPTWTNLTGREPIPDYIEEIEYDAEKIPLSAMATLDQSIQLFEYAHMCSTIGASPEVFTSHTGSDSLGAQHAFFRYLESAGIIDGSTRICDLTAGRGDGLYAGRYLNLDITSFSREDTFTRVLHHPDIQFKKDYDVFMGSTIKFITEYDFIHVDISFAGKGSQNLLDLVLCLEEANIAYSIRLNSIACTGYSEETTKGLPSYDHFISYSIGSSMKPYQIYLVGIPTDCNPSWSGPDMKQTLAFKSMALSYSNLLSPGHQTKRLVTYAPNSASIYVPRGLKGDTFLKKICDDSVELEQQYYLRRYFAEIGADARIEFSYDCLEPRGQAIALERSRSFNISPNTVYTSIQETHIGNVSERSLPHHKKHIEMMRSHQTPIWSIHVLSCDDVFLSYFRIHHPLQEIRTWCNILLGLNKFCRKAILSGHVALLEQHEFLNTKKSSKLSMHQRELHLAIKLLVLAARDDNPVYGVTYCHKLLANKTRGRNTIGRTLRMYRLLSYLFEEIQRLMMRGEICIRSIDAIANEIEIREKHRYKYIRQSDAVNQITRNTETLEHIITNSIDDLFAGLESYANQLVIEAGHTSMGEAVSGELEQMDLSFDLNLEKHIEDMIERLHLEPSGPYGYIDLGDDDIIEHDDW